MEVVEACIPAMERQLASCICYTSWLWQATKVRTVAETRHRCSSLSMYLQYPVHTALVDCTV